jgi:hypothetical protein
MKICRARPQLVFTFDNRFSSTGWAVPQSVRYGTLRLQASYLSATSHTGRKSCRRVKSLYMKRFWCVPSYPQRTHIGRDEIGWVYLPIQPEPHTATLYVMVTVVKGGGRACTHHPRQPGLIFPSWWNVRQKAAVATLSRKLKTRSGARNRFQEPSLDLSGQAK